MQKKSDIINEIAFNHLLPLLLRLLLLPRPLRRPRLARNWAPRCRHHQLAYYLLLPQDFRDRLFFYPAVHQTILEVSLFF